MYYQVISGIVCGVEGKLIHVEVDASRGLPCFSMVGYLSSELKEAKERVISALRSVSFTLPPKRITVNLLPANMRKAGSSFDFPIAIAILGSFGSFQGEQLKNAFLAGEMGLDGRLYPVRGLLPMVLVAKKEGILTCFVPEENEKELIGVQGMDIYLVSTLQEMMLHLQGQRTLRRMEPKRFFLSKRPPYPDFSDVKGQYQVKRALEIAATGRHNLLLIGPAGCGKTLLSRCLPGILPPLEEEELQEVQAIYSARGVPYEEVGYPPVRNPHHTVTPSAFLGGGTHLLAGEITLAHRGILFLDELAEFKKLCLEGLREPMEHHSIAISRAGNRIVFPSDMMVIATMNPCSCGKYPSPECRCTHAEQVRYRKKISRPLMERFDMVIWMEGINQEELHELGETSLYIAQRVRIGRQKQKERYKMENYASNSRIPVDRLEEVCQIDEDTKAFIHQIFDQKGWSMREFHHMLKVARTIADMEEEEQISIQHLAEAVSFYNREGIYE